MGLPPDTDRGTAINSYLLEKAEGDEDIHRLLKLAVEKSLLKYKPPAEDSSKSWNARQSFNSTVQHDFRPDPETDRKIRAIRNWLRYERDHDAPWLHKQDNQDRPLKLATVSLGHVYNKARKHFLRLPRKGRTGLNPDMEIQDNISAYENDIQMDEPTQKAWPLFSKDTPDAFLKRMTEGLPKGTILKIRLAPSGDLEDLQYLHADEKTDFHFNRRFIEKSVFDYGDFVPARLRGQGIGKTVNKHLFALYEEQGIDRMELGAVDLGVYAHARLGFVPDYKSWHKIKHLILKRLDYIALHPATATDHIPPSCLKAIRTALEGDDPKNFWFIVDQTFPYHGKPLGKVLTLPVRTLPKALHQLPASKEELHWSGYLDFTDPDCAQRYRAYLNLKPMGQEPVPATNPGPQHPLTIGLQP